MWRVWKYFLKVVTGHSGQKKKTNPLRLWKNISVEKIKGSACDSHSVSTFRSQSEILQLGITQYFASGTK